MTRDLARYYTPADPVFIAQHGESFFVVRDRQRETADNPLHVVSIHLQPWDADTARRKLNAKGRAK